MINNILDLFAQSIKSVIGWFEQILNAGSAVPIFIAGICAIITARYLIAPLTRTSLRVSSNTGNRSSKREYNDD